MISEPHQLTDKVIADLEAGKKAFHESMAKAQKEIDAATIEVNKLRADMKAQAADVKTKTVAHIAELTKTLDATRKKQQAEIENRLKQLHAGIDSVNAELKHATAEGKVAAEAKAKAAREEYDSARRALTASLEAELVEWKARISTAFEAADEKKAAVTAAVRTKVADLHAKHEAAQKKLHALKTADAAAFSELHKGAEAAIAELKTAIQRAHADIAGS